MRPLVLPVLVLPALILWGCPAQPQAPTPPESPLAASASPSAAPSSWPPTCQNGMLWIYMAPGCGAAAKGSCGAIPPCIEDFCTCDGTTVSGCGATTVPWVSRGKCP